jgi:hypothetical protein
MTVKQELEQMVKISQENENSKERLNEFSQESEEVVALELTVEEEAEGESEHSEECLNIFNRGAEKQEVVALKLAAKEVKEGKDRIITPWEMELEMLEDWLNNQEPARELEKLELSEKKMTEKQVSQEETVELKSAAEWQLEATDEEGDKDEDEKDGMGDHSDLPNGKKILQLRRLQKQSQPLEQLDEVIEEIRELMLKSIGTASKEQLGRRKEVAATTEWSG